MMKFIEFEKEKCDNCYKCLRVCPTKAISFNKTDRNIIDSLCIKCGLCQASCPQEALHIRSQLDEVKFWIANKEPITVSIAPSFVGAFGLNEPEKISGVLKSLGFTYVEETAVGAELIALHYDQVISKSSKKIELASKLELSSDVTTMDSSSADTSYSNDSNPDSFITSCCPSANYLIEQHYPLLLPYVIPVVSPMIAHGRMIKHNFGEAHKVVFIGPCLAKMAEAEELKGSVDAVLTFDELDHLINETGLALSTHEKSPFDVISSVRGCAFPLGGSLREDDGSYRKDGSHRFIHVDGIDNCMSILNELSLGHLERCVIELNICNGSCLNGPDMPKNYLHRYEREIFMRNYIDSKKIKEQDVTFQEKIIPSREAISAPVSIKRHFADKQLKKREPNIEIVKQTLRRMGKYAIKDELNCGACGYKTCYNKAKAVYYGYSDIETCLPYLRKKAESMQSVMIENSPNVVILIDKELTIREVNPSFLKTFNTEDLPVVGLPIELFLKHPVFESVVKMQKSVFNEKIHLKDSNHHFIVNVIFLEEAQMVLAFLTDISEEMKRQEEFNQVKEETLLKTQDVIDKQMRVAQEIASLLGETTAETKMSLLSLKKLVLSDRGVY